MLRIRDRESQAVGSRYLRESSLVRRSDACDRGVMRDLST